MKDSTLVSDSSLTSVRCRKYTVKRIHFRELFREIARGKSIYRTLCNAILRIHSDEIRGVAIDLACGQRPASWFRTARPTGGWPGSITGVDYNETWLPDVLADLRQPLPFRSDSADVVLAFSFIYILAQPKLFLEEIHRVLRPGGQVMYTAPLVCPYIPEPTDHWRFTVEGLQHLMTSVGFQAIEIDSIGGRWTAAVYLLEPFLRPLKIVLPIVFWLCLKLDSWSTRCWPIPDCPIGYFVRGVK